MTSQARAYPSQLPGVPGYQRRGGHKVAWLEADWAKVTAIVLFFFLQFGLFSLVLVGDLVIGSQIASGLLLMALCLAPFKRRRAGFRLSKFEDVFPAVLFITMMMVSYISNNWIFGYGWTNWVLYLYTAVPVFTFYALWMYSVSVRDLIIAIIIVGVLTALIVVADAFYEFVSLNALQRFTNETGVRRITILKNEVVLASLLMLAEILGEKITPSRRLFAISGAVVTFFVVAFRFESRLALLALLSAILVYVISARKLSDQQRLYVAVGMIALIPVASVLYSYYLEPLLNQGLGDYIENHNVGVRIRSNDYYYGYFSKTTGVGFGLMTLNLDSRNFQAMGVPLSYTIADLGMFGGLYQFGLAGILLIVVGTFTLFARLLHLGRLPYHPYRDELRMTGCFVFGFMLQPIPMNFFTLNWTVLLGSTLWYLMRRAMWETRQLAMANSAPKALAS